MAEMSDMAESKSPPGASPSILPLISKTYTLTSEEVEIIQAVAREEGMRTDSSAMRLLIRQGYKFRQLRREAERALIAQALRDEHNSKEHNSKEHISKEHPPF